MVASKSRGEVKACQVAAAPAAADAPAAPAGAADGLAQVAKVLEQATGDATWVNRRADYDRMLDALTVAKAAAGVNNTTTAFGLLLDLAEKHLEEIPSTPRPGPSHGH
jgi:seryl-tRNA(Sec) selenium transferase